MCDAETESELTEMLQTSKTKQFSDGLLGLKMNCIWT